MTIRRRQIKSKATVFFVLQSHPETEGYLPLTKILGYDTLKSMLESYSKVYLKPDSGWRSEGVIQITNENGKYSLSRSDSEGKLQFSKFRNLWNAVKKTTSYTRHVIQQGIESVTEDNRSFDLRTHVLRVDGEWIVGGACVRLGPPGQFITSYHKGGKPISLDNLFNNYLHFSEEDQQQLVEQLHACILEIARKVSPVYPKNKEFGIDIGLDVEKKKLWLYEVNLEPQINVNFKLLSDKSLYKQIRSLRKKAR